MRSLLIGTSLIVFASPALADWWIVRSSDDKCLVVDIEPTGKDKSVTKVGKDVYQTAEQAKPTSNGFAKDQRSKINLHQTLSEILDHDRE